MTKKKTKHHDKPMNRDMIQLANEKLFDYIREQNFDNIEEINEFLSNHVNGKKIDEIIPSKKGRKSNKEKSDDLIYQAYDSNPKKGIKLAKQALELNDENIRAYNYLAENECNADRASELFKKSVDLGEKLLGKQFFKENKGHFWAMHETRPYMTAKMGLANCLEAKGKNMEAVKIYQELLELNPSDNQGVRYILSGLLLHMKQYDEFEKLYKKNNDEFTAFWLYNYALFLFITEGNSNRANKALRDAYNQNKHVIAFMAGQKELKNEQNGYYSPGEESEALYYLMDNFKLWTETPGTADWVLDFNEKLKQQN